MALSVNITPTRVAPGATVTAVVTGTPAEIGRVFVSFAGGGGWGLDHGFRASRAKERDTGEGF